MSRGPERTPEAPRRPPPRRGLAWCVALALFAGCQNASPRGSGPDPLVTSSTLAPSTAAGGGAAPAPGTTNAVPPFPPATSVSSPAALAGGGMPAPAPDSGHNDLRMPALPTGNPTPVAPATSTPGSTPGWPQNGAPVPSTSGLQSPEAAGNAGRLTPVAATPAPTVPFHCTPTGGAAPGPAGGTDTYLQLQEMLRVRGVSWQRLEMVGDAGEWTFRCAIPNPQTPNIRRNYQARAVGDCGLAAIRAVIDQIDREQAGRAPPR
jgi:hypothetical protein